MSVAALEKLQARFGEAVEEVHSQAGDDTCRIAPAHWLAAARFLRDELGFDMFIDLTAVDYLGREDGLPRFEVVLH
jgi:NADH:ubiquinone oxidoreductase subunit C